MATKLYMKVEADSMVGYRVYVFCPSREDGYLVVSVPKLRPGEALMEAARDAVNGCALCFGIPGVLDLEDRTDYEELLTRKRPERYFNGELTNPMPPRWWRGAEA